MANECRENIRLQGFGNILFSLAPCDLIFFYPDFLQSNELSDFARKDETGGTGMRDFEVEISTPSSKLVSVLNRN